MKTIIILLVSVIINTNLLAQNIFSFGPKKEEKESKALLSVFNENEDIDKSLESVKYKTEMLCNIVETITGDKIRDILDPSYKIFLDSLKKEVVKLNDETVDLKEMLDNIRKNITKKARYQDVDKTPESNFQWLFKGGNNTTIRNDFWQNLGESKKSILLGASLSDLGGTMFSEIIVDYLGPLRFSLSTGVTASKDNKEDKAKTEKENKNLLQNFLNAGGNAIIRSTLPLLFYSNRTSDEKKSDTNSRYLSLYFSSKIAGDIPALNSGVKGPSGTISFAFESQYGFLTNNKKFGLEGFVTIGGIYGSSDLMDNLIESGFKHIAFYSQGAIKLTLEEKFSIYFNYPIALGSNRNFAIDKTPCSISISSTF